MSADLRNLPNWAAWIVSFVVVMTVILTFVCAILIVSHFTRPYHKPGPPPSCGNTGVKEIIKNTNSDYPYITIICNNGVTIYHE